MDACPIPCTNSVILCGKSFVVHSFAVIVCIRNIYIQYGVETYCSSVLPLSLSRKSIYVGENIILAISGAQIGVINSKGNYLILLYSSSIETSCVMRFFGLPVSTASQTRNRIQLHYGRHSGANRWCACAWATGVDGAVNPRERLAKRRCAFRNVDVCADCRVDSAAKRVQWSPVGAGGLAPTARGRCTSETGGTSNVVEG